MMFDMDVSVRSLDRKNCSVYLQNDLLLGGNIFKDII